MKFLRRGASRHATGRRGERLAARYLRRNGLRVLQRNLHLGHDEIDLLAQDRSGTLVLVEVKTRTTTRYPIESYVDGRKRAHMIRAARALLATTAYQQRGIRFDVVTVDLTERSPTIRHWPNAFDAG
ncbi:MAG: YraN family protein [Planctomycetota bacterium]